MQQTNKPDAHGLKCQKVYVTYIPCDIVIDFMNGEGDQAYVQRKFIRNDD